MAALHRFIFALLFCLLSPAGAADLPADGGEPGQVVLAALAAQRSGDFEWWSAAWHPRTWEGKEDQIRGMLQRGASMSPLSERILGGSIDGDHAKVQIEATFKSKTANTEAELERLEGKWRLTKM